MNPEIVGVIGVAIMCVFLFSGIWIGIGMVIIGFLGYAYIAGIDQALLILRVQPYTSIANYTLAAAPMFLLMGNIISSTGVAGDLYSTAYKWVGQWRGGLAHATCLASGGFAAICGSSMASLVTIGKIAYPEMKRYGYNAKLSSGVIAAGTTVGTLIPPSIPFIIYGLLTEQSIGKLFMAGIIPGILEVTFYMIVITISCRINPKLGPAGPKTNLKEKIISLKKTWATIALFLLVIGGIYGGIFTPTEAGAVGAFGAVIITLASRRLSIKGFVDSILDTALTSAMVTLLIIGAFIFMRFVTISHLPSLMMSIISQSALSPIVVIIAIAILYIIAGMFMDVYTAVVLTVPVLCPLVTSLGYDGVWFGVIVVRLMELGLITPPVGMNAFILSASTGISVGTIYRGVIPFIVADFAEVILLIAFPVISLLIPNMM